MLDLKLLYPPSQNHGIHLKMGLSNSSYLSYTAIFHFHDGLWVAGTIEQPKEVLEFLGVEPEVIPDQYQIILLMEDILHHLGWLKTYQIYNGIIIILGGAGFCPSTVPFNFVLVLPCDFGGVSSLTKPPQKAFGQNTTTTVLGGLAS